jgi:hypothetical protein
MKKIGIKFLILCSILMIGTACQGNEPIAKTPAESKVETPETSTEKENIPAEFIFELTDEEFKAYELIKKDKNEEHLLGLSPISVAKLYIQASFDKDYETEYALYDTRDVINGVGWTLEEHLKITENDHMTKEEIYEYLVPLINGEFEELSDSGGVIRYQRRPIDTNEDGGMGFQVKKTDKGIWKVCFMPIQ